jgi:hypothetical protein
MTDTKIPATPLIVGLGGLVPFVALLAGAWLLPPPDSGLSARYAAYYGAVILSFVGALHWAFAMLLPIDEFDRGRVYGWSVAQALAAWLALMLPTRAGLLLMAIMFAVHYAMDRRLARDTPLPAWYLRLRLWLTLGAVASLLATLPRAA